MSEPPDLAFGSSPPPRRGYSTLAAHVGPLALDGLMVISGFALLTMSSSPIATRPDQAW
jgi:hypothetical protein